MEFNYGYCSRLNFRNDLTRKDTDRVPSFTGDQNEVFILPFTNGKS